MIRRVLPILIFICSISVFSQDDIDVVDLMKEIQQIKKVESNMKMVWWIPSEYWEVSTKGNAMVTQESVDQLLKVVDPFTIIAALDGDIGLGVLNYKDTLNISINTDSDNTLSPLTNDEIPREVKGVLRTLKPILVNMIGDMGRNLNLYVFSNMDDSGNRIIHPVSKTNFTVVLNEELFKWQLPLDSFVPKKKCPVDNTMLSGNWKYCPWHGTELVD